MDFQTFINETKIADDHYLGPTKIDWLVDDFIPQGALVLWVGASAAAKTTTVLALAADLAAGLSFLGLPSKQLPTLVIDEEMGDFALGPKVVEMLEGANIGHKGIPLYTISYAGANFTSPTEVKRWEGIIRGAISNFGIKLLVLDSLHRLIPGKNDSKIEDVTPLLDTLLRLSRDLGVTIILVHHWNKANSTYRGSTAIMGMVDMLINVKKNGKYITFEIEKNRFGPPNTKFEAIADWSNGKFTLSGLRAPSTPQQQPMTGCPHYTVQAMRNIAGGGTLSEIMQALKDLGKIYAVGSLRNAIRDFITQGIVVRTDQGGKGVEATYKLREAVDPWYAAMNPAPWTEPEPEPNNAAGIP